MDELKCPACGETLDEDTMIECVSYCGESTHTSCPYCGAKITITDHVTRTWSVERDRKHMDLMDTLRRVAVLVSRFEIGEVGSGDTYCSARIAFSDWAELLGLTSEFRPRSLNCTDCSGSPGPGTPCGVLRDGRWECSMHQQSGETMPSQVDHRVLDRIVRILNENVHCANRESDRVEFYDPVESKWFEIVVRQIESPRVGEVESCQ